MRTLACLLFAFVLGCGSSGNGGNGGSGGTGGGGSGGTGGGGSGGSGGGDMAMGPAVSVTGTVGTIGNNMPISGATVSVAGAMPANSTMTDAMGNFTLMIAAGSTVFIRATANGYVSFQNAYTIPAGGGSTGFTLNLIPQAFFAGIGQSLNPMLTVDPTKGIVAVNFHNTSNMAGYKAAISASSGMPFTIDKNGANAMYGDTTQAGGNIVIFPNVATGTTTVTVTPPTGKTCNPRVNVTNYRVDANVVTGVDFDCM